MLPTASSAVRSRLLAADCRPSKREGDPVDDHHRRAALKVELAIVTVQHINELKRLPVATLEAPRIELTRQTIRLVIQGNSHVVTNQHW